MILKRHLMIFGRDFLTSNDARRESLEEKGFVPADEEPNREIFGKNIGKSWKRWITVT